jgi:Protein of unknown function (DUF3574)
VTRSAVWATALAFSAGLAACAGGAAQGPAPVARCEVGDSTMVRDVLYFGRNRPTGGTVSDAEWQAFLNEVVTPRFPAGLTIISATGQWRGQSGSVEQEQSEIMTLFHAGDQAARRGVAEVMAEYKRRFQQEAVLRERTPTCTRFGAGETHEGTPNPHDDANRAAVKARGSEELDLVGLGYGDGRS